MSQNSDVTCCLDFAPPSLVKAMVFPVVMYGCESWTVKKTEHQRIDAFETVDPRGTVSRWTWRWADYGTNGLRSPEGGR